MTPHEDIFQQLDQQIVSLKEKLREKEDLERSLARARRSLNEQRQQLWDLETDLTGEKADVEALETLSLRGIFLRVLGNKQEQLEEERQELLAARLRHDETEEAVGALERDIADLEHRLDQLGDVEARYRSLLKRKEQALLQTDREDARELLRLSEAQGDVQSDLRELREAISAGKSALNSFYGAVSALRGAENWGTVDLLGGGLLTTAAKHGRVDEARRWIHQAQQRLRRFRRELADVEPGVEMDIQVGGFETFADYFFDGLIADWVVQSRIRSSLDRTIEMRRHVETTVNTLQREVNQAERKAERIKEKRQQLIERA